MLEVIVQRIVDEQIKKGSIDELERPIYLYGYRMLIELGISVIASILIAFLFQAYAIVLCFTVAFLLIRGYVGGYHAKTSWGCFCFSVGTLIISTVVVVGISKLSYGNYFFLLEVIMLPCIFRKSPIPNVNKPITENERVYFNKKVKQIYVVELLVALLLLFMEKDTFALSILAVHIVLFIMILMEAIRKMWSHRQNIIKN